MKICILSMQNIQNLGSLLQSYSLKKLLESLGHEVSFIDIEPNAEDNLLMQGRADDYSKEGEATGLLAKIRKVDKYAINRLRIRKLADKQNDLFEDFRKNVLEVDRRLTDEYYDYCVIGSDEVFNCNVASPWGFTSQLFGNVSQANRVITYAASCGSTTYDKLPVGVKDRIAQTFENVSAFSVRDNNTEEFVQKLVGLKPNVNLDPVVVENFEEEIDDSILPEKMPKHYCLVYSYYNRICDKNDIRIIKEFCKKKELEIVSVGAPQMWIRNHLVLTPFQMLKVFQNADFVITDTFHGTIFAAKYSRGFATLLRPSNHNKLSDLISRLHLQRHLMESMSQLDMVSQQDKQQNVIDEIANQERRRTISYLKENIKECVNMQKRGKTT